MSSGSTGTYLRYHLGRISMLNKTVKNWSVAVVLVLLTVACTPSASPEATRLSDLEAKVETLSGMQTELTSLQGEIDGLSADQAAVADLQTRLDSLQTQMEGLAAEIEALSVVPETGEEAPAEPAEDPFAVSVTQYMLDTAGFHGMEETIAETQQIDPAFLGTVNRVQKVLSSAPWPESLVKQGEEFETLLGEFAAALEADDVEAATTLSAEVHDAQHELSEAIDNWLGAAGGDEH
jgi:hypothetical protein